ncbi:MAG: outer membrane protein assembly factor BamE [Hyphomicrobiaceae bacterium]
MLHFEAIHGRGVHGPIYAALILLAVFMNGCTGNVVTHGQHFQDSDIQQIQPGMGEDQVRAALGTPSTTASVGKGNAFYYISSKVREVSVLNPKEIDRRVVAVYFAPTGTVERVAHYGLKDGKVFDFISRKTPAIRTADEGIVRQLFRNLGQKQLYGD